MCAQASVLETMVKLIKLFDSEVKRSANLLTSQTDVQIVSTDDDSDEPEQKRKSKYYAILELDGKIYCNECTTYTLLSDKPNSLVQGSASYRIMGLDKHWSLKQHKRAAQWHHLVEAVNHSNSVKYKIKHKLPRILFGYCHEAFKLLLCHIPVIKLDVELHNNSIPQNTKWLKKVSVSAKADAWLLAWQPLFKVSVSPGFGLVFLDFRK